ncbi:MAG: response regulator [Desulfovibrio sp.]|nr:response regulator [Desulfovibrio sp.]
MRVLIVDDEASFAEPLAERLRLRGVDTVVAADADAALAELVHAPRDLIFLDVGLPGLDGVGLLPLLRERYPQCEVVMLSGAGDVRKAVQAMRYGALNWLSKPVSLEDVLAECRKATERATARLEAQRLTEAARWRMLGRVAEGVAHEVNNPLNIIVQAAGLIEDCLDTPQASGLPEIDEAREALAAISAQGLRIRELTRKLLMVGHGMDFQEAPLDGAACVRHAVEMLRKRLDDQKVQLELSVPEGDGAPRPFGSATELQQICLHLLENALDALEISGRADGRITVQALKNQDAQGRDWYELTVQDNGPGIAQEAFPHLFDPFFSTRSLQGEPKTAQKSRLLGRFAGLGLSVARSLAHARGGELTGDNASEGGARFVLRLPLAGESCER